MKRSDALQKVSKGRASVLTRLGLFSVFALTILILLSPQNSHAVDVPLEWDANTQPELAGYRLFVRAEGESYDYTDPAWEGTDTTCTIYGLDDSTTYHFVARAFDLAALETSNSNEVSYPEVQQNDPPVADESSQVEVRINAPDNDVEERADGSMYMNSSDLELTEDAGSAQTVGMRFVSVEVPQGATITNAYVQFQVDEASTGATSLFIEADASDNASAFSSTDYDVSSRARTAASVSWQPADWGTTGDAGPDQRTPDISFVVQEIADRAGWQSGNALGIIITGSGKRTAEAYDGDSSAAPLLHVEYTVDSSSPDPEPDPEPGADPEPDPANTSETSEDSSTKSTDVNASGGCFIGSLL